MFINIHRERGQGILIVWLDKVIPLTGYNGKRNRPENKMGCISEYRKFTYFLCEHLTKKDLDSMKFLLRDLLTTREIEDVAKPGDLFVLLEQRNELGSDNFRLLQDLLKMINRHDLARKLNEFERKQLAKRFGNYETATEDSRTLNTPQFAKDCATDNQAVEAGE